MTSIKFKSLSSGSCGNCYWLGIVGDDGSVEAGIIIDTGVSPRRLKPALAGDGIRPDAFDAVLITHDHYDHVHFLGSYCKRFGKPVWSTPTLGKVLSGLYSTGPLYRSMRRDLGDGWNEIIPGRVKVRWFEVPHDAHQTVGFAILMDGHRYVHITDCGRMTEEALSWCRQADTVVLESNYDLHMLLNGPYPKDLQDRIRQGHGHLSNDECADAIREFDHPELRSVFLCHLSEHNNTPALAVQASRQAFHASEARLIPLPRETMSPLFTL